MSNLEHEAKALLERGNEGDQVLNGVHDFCGRFIAYPDDHCQIAHTLWIAHTHSLDAFESTPRLAFLSPEPASGKSRALEITGLLVPNPVESVNSTEAFILRRIGTQENRPTVLFDEVDAIFGPLAKPNEGLRALINAGHRANAKVGRCIGNDHKPEEISAYAALALGGLGDLPDTIMTRSVVIRMQRRAPHQQIESFRFKKHTAEAQVHHDALVHWTQSISSEIDGADPDMPLEDRPADVWLPLIALADAAGGDWPHKARAAAIYLVKQSTESSPSLGINLLHDLRIVFSHRPAMFTPDLLKGLHRLDESPWGDRQLDPRGLATYLKQYGIKPKQIRIGERSARGYKSGDFADAWQRYCPQDDLQMAS